jgi:ABC-type transporter Mla maintaining outer membrane lipid asymmetry ATPase subunit MlaF/ABC-type transporter Mla maintaining outer membrane lipid asymmetry permease subunit MlaE
MTSTESAALVLDRLSVQAGERELLNDVSLTIPPGGLSVIIGGSGAGKSVLLRLIAGLVPTDAADIRSQGVLRIVEPDNDGDNATVPHRVGIVFQNFALFDEWSALDNVQFAIDHRRNLQSPPLRTALEWLEELRVDPRARPATMSGGQKQRLAIARTLAAEPSVVLYDEPTSGLDRSTGREVAALITATHEAHRQTSILVTHDYETLLPIADYCWLLDSHSKTLREVPKADWDSIAGELKPVHVLPKSPSKPSPSNGESKSLVGLLVRSLDDMVIAVGKGAIAMGQLVKLPLDVARSRYTKYWAWRFFAHSMRLICGPSSWGYLAMAGAIIGFTSTYFTFRFLPFQLYSKPLLIEDLLASIGFALYRILVPVLATILIAARCGAAIAADVGVKRYGAQVDALQTLGVRPPVYLLAPTVLAFLIATPFLQWIAFETARWVSLICFTATHPEAGPYFWQQYFYRNLDGGRAWALDGWNWVLLKALLCGVGISAISYHRGLRPKASAGEVSEAITATVLWSTLYVLVVHFIIALIEF